MKMVMRTCALGAIFVLCVGLSSQGCDDNRCTSNDDTIQIGDRVIKCSDLTGDSDPVPPVEMDAGPDGDAGPDVLAPPLEITDPIGAFEYHPTGPTKPPPAFFNPAPADPPGPKDPEAVVAAAIFLQSCVEGMYFSGPQIDTAAYEIYQTIIRDPAIGAFFARSGCFKNKANGCDAVMECVGYRHEVYQINQPLETFDYESKCVDGVRQRSGSLFFDGSEPTVNEWFNCKGLGLQCYDDRTGEPCSSVRTPCDPLVDTEKCRDDRPYNCSDSYNFGKFYNFQNLKCSDFGMSCLNQYYCVPPGPACVNKSPYGHSGQLFSYGVGGIACDSPTQLRICMDGFETTIDCPTLADGFGCIPGDVPRCGLANECEPTGVAYCDGDSIVVCDAGKIRAVNCKSLGFTGCNEKWGVCSGGLYDYK